MQKFNFSAVSSILAQLPNIIVIGLLIVGGLFIYKEFKVFTASFGTDIKALSDDRFDEKQRQIDELNRRYLQLDENIARAYTQIVSASKIERMFKETINSKIQEIVEKNNEEVASIGKAIFDIGRNLDVNFPSEGEKTFTTPSGQEITIKWTYAYADSQDGKRGIRLAHLAFDETNNEWDKFTEPLEFHVTSVRTEQKSGNYNHYIEAGLKSPNDPIYKNTIYRLGIDTFFVAEREKKLARWHILQPHIEGGFGSNISTSEPVFGYDLGMSLFAFGRTPHDNYWRFARVGIGITHDTDNIFGTFSPAGLNVRILGVPFLKDTWIFPGVSLRKAGELGFAASLSTTF